MIRSWARRAVGFLGPRVSLFLILGLAIGVSLSAVELAFAYSLQAFLMAIGALSPTAAQLPRWLPHASLKVVLALILSVGTIRALLNAAQIFLQGAAHEELRHRHRSLLLSWALRSESTSTAKVLTLFNVGTEMAGGFISHMQNLAIQLTSAMLLAAVLLAMAPLVTLAAGAGFAAVAAVLLLMDRKALAAGAGLAREMDKTTARLVISLKNLLLLQIYGTVDREEAATRESLDAFRGHVMAAQRIIAIKYAVPQVFGVGLVCFIALASTTRHGMSPGVLVSYFYLLMRLLLMFSGINQSISGAIVAWPNTRALATWREGIPPEHALPRQASATTPLEGPVGWELSGVGFSYPGSNRAVLEALDLRVAPGQSLVIVGPSGSGKSTLLAVMLGLLKPGKGRVDLLLGAGAPVSLEPRRAQLLRSIGYVGPESFLIEGTIRENLFYGLEHDPSGDEIQDALLKAECRFVEELPHGLEHRLTEQGQGLSAGQKQRLCLARALLRRPRALVLDEATSNLDAATEARLIETLLRLKERVTLLVVTHRPTLLGLADQRLELQMKESIMA